MDNINVKRLLKTVEGTVEQYLQWFNGLTPEEQAVEKKRVVFIHDTTGKGIAIIANGNIYRTSLQGDRGYQGYQGYHGHTGEDGQRYAVEVTCGCIEGDSTVSFAQAFQSVLGAGDQGAFYIPYTPQQYIYYGYTSAGGYFIDSLSVFEVNGAGSPIYNSPYDIRYSDGFSSTSPISCIGHKLVLHMFDIDNSLRYRVEFEILSTDNTYSAFRVRVLGYNVWGAGLQGATGLQGTRGIQGYQGYQGYQGTRGIRGYQGYQGYQGARFSASIVHSVTSTSPASWFIPDVSDYFISGNDVGNVFLNKNYQALNLEIHNLSWEQINFTLSGIYDPKVTDVSGFLDDLEKNYMYKIYVENDIYTMLTNSTCVLKVKLIRGPESIAVIECYVDRSATKI